MTYTNANDIASEAAAYLIEEWAIVNAASEADSEDRPTPQYLIERYEVVMNNLRRLIDTAQNMGVYDEVKRLVDERVRNVA